MKKLYLLIFTSFFVTVVKSQNIEVIYSILSTEGGIVGMVADNESLYYSYMLDLGDESGETNGSWEGQVYKIPLEGTTDEAELIIEGLGNVEEITIYDNYLYVSETDSQRILRYDLSNPDMEAEEFISGLNASNIIAYDGNIYYGIYIKN